MQSIASARASAQQLPGARQVQDFAQAVHGAYLEGDYKATPQKLAQDAGDVLAQIDRAVPNAAGDAPTLVAWRALMESDLHRYEDSNRDFMKSFEMAPNALAGRNLIMIYGAANLPQKVGATCAATIEVMRGDDDKLDLIAMCRKHMNAATPEGEMAWMSPELVRWYQGENARRMQAQIDQQNAQAEQDRRDQRVVRQHEQCADSCKERGLMCQNRCSGDAACDDRCVEANHACVDRCTSAAYEKLGY